MIHGKPTMFFGPSATNCPDANPRAATIREVRVGGVKARAAVRRPGAKGISVHHARGQVGVLIHRGGLEVIETSGAFWGGERGLGFKIWNLLYIIYIYIYDI